VNEFAIAVMDEIGIDLSHHQSKTFDELEDTSFDLIISLTPEAQHSAVELTRTLSAEVEYWATLDPSAVPADRRELILDAYRGVRDSLMSRIRDRFSQGPAPTT
jgi:protein-tyrosine-phosphatase